MKFLIDMPLSPHVATWLANRHDAGHAVHVGLTASADDVILQRAHSEGRIVVTADLDFPRLMALSGADTPAIILFRGGAFAENQIIAGLELLFDTLADDMICKSVVVIEHDRIRRRSLPIQ